MNNEFALKSPPCEAHLHSKYFRDLEQQDRDKFINYRIDMYEVTNATDLEVRQMYSRVNKYVKALNKQELRRADFPGDFLDISEELASLDVLEEFKIFTPANRRRMADIEFISELLALMIRQTPLDKKEQLDLVYEEYMEWSESQRNQTTQDFNEILDDLQTIFGKDGLDEIKLTRFHQKSDFYSLFGAIFNLRQNGGNLTDRDLEPLRRDLVFLNCCIEPSSDTTIFREYAIRCVSDANSASSRRWRTNFLEKILQGTYLKDMSEDTAAIFSKIIYEGGDVCPPGITTCPISNIDFQPYEENSVLAWNKNDQVFQMENALFIRRAALEEVAFNSYLVFDPLSQKLYQLSQESDIDQCKLELDYD
jgi:hypothetical protein